MDPFSSEHFADLIESGTLQILASERPEIDVKNNEKSIIDGNMFGKKHFQ